MRIHSEAVEILRQTKQVRVRDLESRKEYLECYDKLVYSPGARAALPPFVPQHERVLTLRTVEDTFRIDDFIKEKSPKSALVIGGGFIGLEAAENLLARGLKVTLVELGDQVMPPFDYDMACILHSRLREGGIDLRLSEKVAGLSADDKGVRAQIEGKGEICADVALVAVGVTPETQLAKAAGLELSLKGAVVTDEHMRTSDPDIYAVGDAVQVRNFVTGENALFPLAGPANKQGRIAADNICGIFSPDHATYYPGARNMTLKVVYAEADGRILGAQAVGFNGVDKRIDVLATAVRAKMTAQDLTELDLCYAPPFSSAKDPVNMAGYVIENIRSGLVRQHTWEDVVVISADRNAVLLDVQTPAEYAAAHLDGAVNIPVDELRGRMSELDKSKTIYVNCYSGLRSYIACRMLAANGFRCSNMAGGIRFYKVVAEGGKYDSVSRHLCGMKNE